MPLLCRKETCKILAIILIENATMQLQNINNAISKLYNILYNTNEIMSPTPFTILSTHILYRAMTGASYQYRSTSVGNEAWPKQIQPISMVTFIM